ncbi:MAG: hypothetical protein EOO50_09840 [Flavobacterium sp.]|uniref:hypothetical protein n=1 Tax=Flavobacterium sp. TaxID=239 RepID=UPI0011FAF68A|nr:hypothetical protein [Flavobacterium sp.]RZJ66367.1 MAG: hypothetical protein EOO50_09840 [Flavobacterium sp.]
MMYVLAFTIVVLLGVIVFQILLLRRSQRQHEQRMEVLREVIVQLANSNSAREKQVKVSDELMQKLRSVNVILSQDISAMVKDFVATLHANDLIK